MPRSPNTAQAETMYQAPCPAQVALVMAAAVLQNAATIKAAARAGAK